MNNLNVKENAMKTILILSTAVILLGGLLFLEKKENQKGTLIIKAFLSGLFIFTALIQPFENKNYYTFIAGGLIFSFIGDLCLVFFFNKKTFNIGLLSFLIGHIFYIIAFVFTSGITSGTWLSLIFIIPFSFSVFLKLKPHLGSMTIPTTAYLIIISLMVASAASFLTNNAFQVFAKTFIFIGAVLFYISDLFVARHRFISKENINGIIGYPMYYSAQFILAFSISLV